MLFIRCRQITTTKTSWTHHLSWPEWRDRLRLMLPMLKVSDGHRWGRPTMITQGLLSEPYPAEPWVWTILCLQNIPEWARREEKEGMASRGEEAPPLSLKVITWVPTLPSLKSWIGLPLSWRIPWRETPIYKHSKHFVLSLLRFTFHTLN